MVNLEYFNGKKWVPAGGSFGNEMIAWVSLGGDDFNYRTVDDVTGDVLTDKSKQSRISADQEPNRKDGEPCSHPGCRGHLKHPCERCFRIAAWGEFNPTKHHYFL
ncbi:hypothetical protein KAR91_68745 [Candidatus Pacearchaeota archaeon]|nr:hypothetical protein [Candidatus Pacearchaeota archaeon]